MQEDTISEAPFRLANDNVLLVEPVRPSGITSSGLYILDQESDMDYKTSMLLEVVGKNESCPFPGINIGSVYVAPVYCYEDMEIDGQIYHYTHAANLQCEVEGYYEAAGERARAVGAT